MGQNSPVPLPPREGECYTVPGRDLLPAGTVRKCHERKCPAPLVQVRPCEVERRVTASDAVTSGGARFATDRPSCGAPS